MGQRKPKEIKDLHTDKKSQATESTQPTQVEVKHHPRLFDASGAVLVDAKRCPHLHRALDRGLKSYRATRAQWQEIVSLRQSGRTNEADDLVFRLLVPAAAASAPVRPIVDLPVDAQELVKRLKSGKLEKREASKIRAKLRSLGHKGGARGV